MNLMGFSKQYDRKGHLVNCINHPDCGSKIHGPKAKLCPGCEEEAARVERGMVKQGADELQQDKGSRGSQNAREETGTN